MRRGRDDDLTFGQWLSRQMTARGFTSNVDLERASGVGNTTISRWRNDETVPTVEQLRKLEGPLAVPVLQMMVRAGHLSPDEAHVTPPAVSEPVGRSGDPDAVLALDDMTPEQRADVRRYAEFIRSQNPHAR